MSDAVPHAVLSEQIQDLMAGRRLVAAVFVTFQFDPGFFECEVLPVVVDVALSHAAVMRRVQLEDSLRPYAGCVAVYYDANGLVHGDSGSAKLDFQRVPVRRRTGVFHPKNVFLLLEDRDADDNGQRSQSLIVGAMSANLTRAGWWANVEAAHFEEIRANDRTLLRDDVLAFVRELKRGTPAESSHHALDLIRVFLKSTEQRQRRSSDGELHPRFYGGSGALIDFLDGAVGGWLRGAYLEIISPYLDEAETCDPLDEMIRRFEPKEVRVFLPRTRGGDAAVCQELYESLRAEPRVNWGRLPASFLRLGKAENAGERFVHAKVYRFFKQKPKREICFIGSVNLTKPAHQREGGNWETGMLVEVRPPVPEFWLIGDNTRPKTFEPSGETDAATAGGTPLTLRYHWDTHVAKAFWDARIGSSALRIEARGVVLGELTPLPPGAWINLPAEIAQALQDALRETSFITVHGLGDEPALLLVQEEGMSHKPSLVLDLSATDILRYWALLTAEQRSAFLESHAPQHALLGDGADLVTVVKALRGEETFFDRLAGFFHAFHCLEREVREQLKAGRPREACYRLFGKKYDSLGTLIERVAVGSGVSDDVDRYVILMCARQLCQELAREHAEFWSDHRRDTRALDASLSCSNEVRERLVAKAPETMPSFLDWFDRWFLKCAKPLNA